MASQTEATIAAVKQMGIIAIIRGDYTLDELHAITDALVSGGLSLVEITLNTPDALTAITQLSHAFNGRAHIGAGTVRTAHDAERALDAGAEYLICPNFSPAVIAAAQQRDRLVIPGVLTPTEAQTARDVGCTLVKLFPAQPMGGAEYLKAIRAPLDDIGFIPTGGVSTANMRAYQEAGAAAVALGSQLVPARHWSPEKIAASAAECRAIWQGEPISRTI